MTKPKIPVRRTKKLALYLHIPFCEKKCAYCDFNSYEGQSQKMKDYVRALLSQMEEYSSSGAAYTVDTVYIGGGTPTCLPLPLLVKILRGVKKYFALEGGAEFTCEANPKSALFKTLARLRREGVNRLSLGLQSADPTELAILGRIHTREEFCTCFDDARKAGFANINVDIMFSLPGQTEKTLEATLDWVAAKGPEHISCYSLTLSESTPMGRQKESLNLPGEEEDRRLYRLCNDYLEEAGWRRYEISNFAKEGFLCRHNFKYWNCEEYLGLGAGAHSYFGGKRFSFPADLDTYVEGVKTGHLQAVELMDIPYGEAVGEYIMLRLRTSEGIDKRAFLTRFRFSFDEAYSLLIERFCASGHMENTPEGCFLTLAGIDVSNYIISAFLAHPVEVKMPHVDK